jgi:hypothetical protein
MFAVPSFFGYNTTFVSTPVATAATGVGETSFTANWNAFSGASYYLLDVSTSSSFSSFVGSYQNFVVISNSQVVSGLTANTTYYYRLRAATGVDADAASFFSRVYTAGGALSYTEVSATETLVASLKANSLWTPMKAIYPMVGASAAACAQNLKSSSFTGTFTSGWTFASTGVTGNGTSAYFDTAFNHNLLAQNSGHLSIYIRTDALGSFTDIGADGVTNSCSSIWSRLSNLTYNQIHNASGSYQTVANTNSQGHYISNRTGSTVLNQWKNGSKTGTSTAASVTPSSALIYVGALNSAGVASFFTSRQYAFASIGDGLTDTQASNFYTCVQTFNQTLNRQVGAQIVSDADAQAYINRVYTAGGTLTNTEANAVNQLTIDMKAAGIWTAMKAVYPMVGSSAAACAQNLKSSSFTGTFTSGWTFASTGVTPNGTSAYMDTNLVPNTSLTLNNTHLCVYSRTNVSGATLVDIGTNDNATTFIPLFKLYLRTVSNSFDSLQYSFAGGQTLSVSNSDSRGLFVSSRISSTSHKTYINGTLLGTNTTTQNQTTISKWSLYLGASNNNNVGGDYSTRQLAFSSIGDGLTDTQASNFYTAVQAMQVTLSRSV